MLINERKFDLRIYVVITSINPLRIYLYNEGIVRFATENYTKKKLHNLFIHLTNYSINKHNTDTKTDKISLDHNKTETKWTFERFRKYLESIGIKH